MKLVLTPHLAMGVTAVIGIVPEHRFVRYRWALLWPLFGQGRAFDKSAFPRALAPVPTEWRVINFAADPTRSGAGTAIALSRVMLSVADAQAFVLRTSARAEDVRLERAYRRHGFVRTTTNPARRQRDTAATVEMRRLPASGERVPVPRNILRTGRTDRAFAGFVFGDDWERPGSRLLDLGAGDSPLAHQLRELGWCAVALDRDYAGIRPAHSAVAVAGDCAALPFADDSFDVVVAVWVLLHVDDVDACVREIARVLRPTGALFLHPLWVSGARLRRIARLPGVTVREGRMIRPRRRPCASVDAEAIGTWDDHQRAAFHAAVRPGRVVRALGQFATDIIVRVTGNHRISSSGIGDPWH